MIERCLSLYLDESQRVSKLVIGDALWDTRVCPVLDASRRIVRIELERGDETVAFDLVCNADGDDEFRVASLPAGHELACSATHAGEPLASIYAEPQPTLVFVVYAAGDGRERVLACSLGETSCFDGDAQ